MGARERARVLSGPFGDADDGLVAHRLGFGQHVGLDCNESEGDALRHDCPWHILLRVGVAAHHADLGAGVRAKARVSVRVHILFRVGVAAHHVDLRAVVRARARVRERVRATCLRGLQVFRAER